MSNCLNINALFLLTLSGAELFALGFRWGWARAVTKHDRVRDMVSRLNGLRTPQRPNVRRTPR